MYLNVYTSGVHVLLFLLICLFPFSFACGEGIYLLGWFFVCFCVVVFFGGVGGWGGSSDLLIYE